MPRVYRALNKVSYSLWQYDSCAEHVFGLYHSVIRRLDLTLVLSFEDGDGESFHS